VARQFAIDGSGGFGFAVFVDFFDLIDMAGNIQTVAEVREKGGNGRKESTLLTKQIFSRIGPPSSPTVCQSCVERHSVGTADSGL
jgi:hypothetical protein